MALLPHVANGEVGLVIGPRAERDRMLELTAVLALTNRVQVLDGGNSFDAYCIARLIRRRTLHLTETVQRIKIARAFTCYQVISLFEQTPVSDSPHLVFDLLATFYDENVTTIESFRLLKIVINHLKRLSQYSPVVVSVRPPPTQQPDRIGLVMLLKDIATHVFIEEIPIEPIVPRLL